MSCCGGNCSCGKRDKTPVEEYNLLVQGLPAGNMLSTFGWISKPENLVVEEEIVEIRFKNKRRVFYTKPASLQLSKDDRVLVKADGGYDLGTVFLTGSRAAAAFDEKLPGIQKGPLERVLRKADIHDLELWLLAKKSERNVLREARNLAHESGLDIRIEEAEIRADGRKVTLFCAEGAEMDISDLAGQYKSLFKMDVELLKG